jgi:hypothetical protein
MRTVRIDEGVPDEENGTQERCRKDSTGNERDAFLGDTGHTAHGRTPSVNSSQCLSLKSIRSKLI